MKTATTTITIIVLLIASSFSGVLSYSPYHYTHPHIVTFSHVPAYMPLNCNPAVAAATAGRGAPLIPNGRVAGVGRRPRTARVLGWRVVRTRTIALDSAVAGRAAARIVERLGVDVQARGLFGDWLNPVVSIPSMSVRVYGGDRSSLYWLR